MSLHVRHIVILICELHIMLSCSNVLNIRLSSLGHLRLFWGNNGSSNLNEWQLQTQWNKTVRDKHFSPSIRIWRVSSQNSYVDTCQNCLINQSLKVPLVTLIKICDLIVIFHSRNGTQQLKNTSSVVVVFIIFTSQWYRHCHIPTPPPTPPIHWSFQVFLVLILIRFLMSFSAVSYLLDEDSAEVIL